MLACFSIALAPYIKGLLMFVVLVAEIMNLAQASAPSKSWLLIVVAHQTSALIRV